MIKKFIKKEPVLVFAWVAAVISCLAVPVNKDYISYIDFRTLGLLFCLMCVTGGLKKLGVFRIAGEKLLLLVKNSIQLELILVMLCFFYEHDSYKRCFTYNFCAFCNRNP